MPETLNDIERRVLGALIEKKLAQPSYYPMTPNAIVAACNQKSNRDPVMSLDESTVFDILEGLRDRELVTRIAPGGASRTDRFRHEAAQKFGWQSAHQAIMAELLLRGPQTIGELRQRCARMHAFESPEALTESLEQLCQWNPPMACVMARQPGQSAVRYRHTLYEPEEIEALGAAAASTVVVAPQQAIASPASSAPYDDSALREEVVGLQEELGELHEEVADLRRRLERLEEHLGA